MSEGVSEDSLRCLPLGGGAAQGRARRTPVARGGQLEGDGQQAGEPSDAPGGPTRHPL